MPGTAPPVPDTSGVVLRSEAPVSVGPEWVPTIEQPFDTPAPLGRFAEKYPGWAGYDSFRDTGGYGLYDSRRVVSVENGILTQHLHTDNGQPVVVSITPVPHVQTYGRYEIRFRADVIPGYKFAWLLWPADNDWREGEINFPEAWLEPGEKIRGFSHEVRGDPRNNAWVVETGRTPQEWHTAVIEWRPDSLTFILDGVAQTTTDPHAVPNVPMFWSLQAETIRHPAPEVSGRIQIDHVRAWTYQPVGG
jgi:hypothetical protein